MIFVVVCLLSTAFLFIMLRVNHFHQDYLRRLRFKDWELRDKMCDAIITFSKEFSDDPWRARNKLIKKTHEAYVEYNKWFDETEAFPVWFTNTMKRFDRLRSRFNAKDEAKQKKNDQGPESEVPLQEEALAKVWSLDDERGSRFTGEPDREGLRPPD